MNAERCIAPPVTISHGIQEDDGHAGDMTRRGRHMGDKLDHLGGEAVFAGRIGDVRTGQKADQRVPMAVRLVSLIRTRDVVDLVQGHRPRNGDQGRFEMGKRHGQQVRVSRLAAFEQEIEVAKAVKAGHQGGADRGWRGDKFGVPMVPDVFQEAVLASGGQRLPRKPGRGRPKLLCRGRAVRRPRRYRRSGASPRLCAPDRRGPVGCGNQLRAWRDPAVPGRPGQSGISAPGVGFTLDLAPPPP